MKKFLFFVVAIVFAGVFTSCEKNDSVVEKKEYAKVMKGDFQINPTFGDLLLKSGSRVHLKAAPAVGGREFRVYRKSTTGWSYVDGSEFLPNSDAYLDWSTPGTNPKWFDVNSQIRVTYCPILPMRFAVLATTGAKGSPYSYLGMYDCTPDANSFPLPVNCRRLGDKLSINVADIKKLEGYKNLSFSVSYSKSVIDIDKTIQTSLDTRSEWPNFVYSAVNKVDDQVVTDELNDFLLYEGLDSKVTGTITIKINVDGRTITKTVDALGLGKGLKIVLKTNKVGWYDSGNFNITETDITVETVIVNV